MQIFDSAVSHIYISLSAVAVQASLDTVQTGKYSEESSIYGKHTGHRTANG